MKIIGWTRTSSQQSLTSCLSQQWASQMLIARDILKMLPTQSSFHPCLDPRHSCPKARWGFWVTCIEDQPGQNPTQPMKMAVCRVSLTSLHYLQTIYQLLWSLWLLFYYYHLQNHAFPIHQLSYLEWKAFYRQGIWDRLIVIMKVLSTELWFRNAQTWSFPSLISPFLTYFQVI